mgnify:CR=1 FL=1|tara:strand:- start:267 stop:773 length:507 start_codon:yes stop_codon:yes gene_type:complete
MHKGKNISQKIDKFIDLTGSFSSYFVPILILIIFVSVLLRYLFSVGFTWLQDLYIWIHATIILCGAAYTLKSDGHVRIDIIYRNSSILYKNIVNFIGLTLFSLPFCYLLVNKGFEYFYRSFLLNESSKETGGLPYIYILKFFIFFMGMTLFIQILNLLFKLLKGKKWN